MIKYIKYLAIVSMLSGCSATRSSIYLADSEIELNMKRCEKMELNFLLYREGSAGATGGKAGGGCGCN